MQERNHLWPAAPARGSIRSPAPSASSCLPVYDKPMVYYPLSTLMLAGIRDILLITTPRRLAGLSPLAGRRLADRHFDPLCPQPKPEGLAQAFIIGREFVGSGPRGACAGR